MTMARPSAPLVAARFLKIEHNLFSLPVIFAGTLLAWRAVVEGVIVAPVGDTGVAGAPTPARIGWILAAGVGARATAMALNRIIDRKIDAANPRTAARELPAGALTLRAAWGIAAAGLALYLLAAAAISPACLMLSPIPLVVFTGYPYLKRVTPLCHFGVGAALALAPLGGWLAAGPRTLGELAEAFHGGVPIGAVAPVVPALLLALFTFLWVAGFDVIYATLDEAFDRAHGIRSLPASLGRARALGVAAALHIGAVAALAALWRVAFAGALAPLPFLVVVAALLALEHRSAHNVDLAFFKLNVVVGVVVFAYVAAGVWARG